MNTLDSFFISIPAFTTNLLAVTTTLPLSLYLPLSLCHTHTHNRTLHHYKIIFSSSLFLSFSLIFCFMSHWRNDSLCKYSSHVPRISLAANRGAQTWNN